jgi:hypothetical protein
MSLPILKYRQQRIEARRQLSPHERRAESQKDIHFWTNLGLANALIIGLIVIIAHGGILTSAIAAFGAALGTGGILGFLFGVPSAAKAPVNINNAGSVAVGTGNDSRTTGGAVNDPTATAATVQTTTPPGPSLVATPATDTTASDPSAPSTSTPTTDDTTPPHSISNLEQVADWVTKLLLGGGLTQIEHIPPTIWRWSQIVAWGIIGDNATVTPQRMQAEQSFSAGLLVYGFVLGFFAGFLITKLQLGKAIAD